MPKDASDPGDAALGRALAAAGSAYDPKAVRALVRGVLAAPPAADPQAWMALVAAVPGEKLRAALGRIHAALAAERASAPPTAGERLAALRAELAARGLDGFMVPRADEHQG
ncbi:MAG: aminopeptidase P family protein, partial [Alphaproteobacteria bacterium]